MPWRSLAIGATVFGVTFVVTSVVCAIVDRKASAGGAPVHASVVEAVAGVRTEAVAEPARPRVVSALQKMIFPTDRTNLLDAATSASAFVPTNAEIPETALYGSARTGSDGRARFHKGVDIAPVCERTRGGEPTDPVYAVADGTVLYVNRVGGNSSYGIHVVLLHEDPVGKVYTLYAHLASVPSGVRKGVRIKQGETLGILGRTSSATKIPTWKAHLHFEAGLLLNSRFAQWERKTKQTPIRGNGHGWNLLALDPLNLLQSSLHCPGEFSMLSYLQSLEPAFTMVLRVSALPDYFRMYPALWQGEAIPSAGGEIVLAVSESGLLLSGRLASAEEAALLPTKKPRVAVLKAFPAVLGRNGRRLVVKDQGQWRFGSSSGALHWLEVLTF